MRSSIRVLGITGALTLAALGTAWASMSLFPVDPAPAHVVTVASEVAPESPALWGNCARFEGSRTVYACVPSFDPNGNEIADIYEDGSAIYQNSDLVFDPEDMAFRLRGMPLLSDDCRWEDNPSRFCD